MAEVIPFKKEEQADPHLQGPVRCLACRHEWPAVVPAGRYGALECPECGLLKGTLIHMLAPEVVWTCGCGCDIFAISGKTKDILCVQCGAAQSWDKE